MFDRRAGRRRRCAQPAVLFLGENPAQSVFEIALEVTQRALLPERHKLVGPVEKRHKWCCTSPEESPVLADLEPDMYIGQPLGLSGADVHIAVATGAVEAVEQQLTAECPGDGGVTGQMEGHPDRIRIADLVPELHRDPERELLGDEEAHHDLSLNRLAHRSTPQ